MDKEQREYYKEKAINTLGETRMMNCGEIAFIVDYKNTYNVIVQFKNTGELVKCEYGQFKNGRVKSHFTPTVFGVGIVGLESTIDENNKNLKSYDTWRDMLRRCYSNDYSEKHPTYKNVTCCDEWLYYSNFKEWYDKNIYYVENIVMNLDKDILVKGNKVYSPEMCIIVPQNINKLFTKSDKTRGDLPIGICMHGDKYKVSCGIFDVDTKKSRKEYIGVFDTVEYAFNKYKTIKENNIKNVAEYYKRLLPKKLYETMYNYKVEITD